MPEFLLSLFASLVLTLGNFFPSLPEKFHAQTPIEPSVLTDTFDQEDVKAMFHDQSLLTQDVVATKPRLVLGSSDQEKRIEVDLAKQRLYAYEGDHKVYDFIISSGKWGRTPTGTFEIWGKFKYTKMSGGSRALNTYYYLPNVPYVMFFSNDEIAASRGFSLHGTYWHNNFGTPMSHGCVNMRTEDAGILFYWTQPSVGEATTARANEDNPGTKVIIYGTAPKG